MLIIIIKELFVNNIEQLIHSLPLNHKTEAGNLFWSGSKRPPQLVPYNSEDPLCLNFVNSAANLYAFVFGIENCKDLEYVRKKSDLITIPKFKVKVVDSKVIRTKYSYLDKFF